MNTLRQTDLDGGAGRRPYHNVTRDIGQDRSLPQPETLITYYLKQLSNDGNKCFQLQHVALSIRNFEFIAVKAIRESDTAINIFNT